MKVIPFAFEFAKFSFLTMDYEPPAGLAGTSISAQLSLDFEPIDLTESGYGTFDRLDGCMNKSIPDSAGSFNSHFGAGTSCSSWDCGVGSPRLLRSA